MLIIKQNGVQLIDHDYEKHLFSQAGLFESFGLQKGQFVTGFFNDLFVELLKQGSLCLSIEKIDKNRQLP